MCVAEKTPITQNSASCSLICENVIKKEIVSFNRWRLFKLALVLGCFETEMIIMFHIHFCLNVPCAKHTDVTQTWRHLPLRYITWSAIKINASFVSLLCTNTEILVLSLGLKGLYKSRRTTITTIFSSFGLKPFHLESTTLRQNTPYVRAHARATM